MDVYHTIYDRQLFYVPKNFNINFTNTIILKINDDSD